MEDNREKAQKFLEAELAKMTAKATGLEKDMAALQQEYIKASDDEAPELVKKQMRKRMPRALQILDELMESASDGTRAGLVRWVIDRGLTPDVLGGQDPASRELAKLIKEMSEK